MQDPVKESFEQLIEQAGRGLPDPLTSVPADVKLRAKLIFAQAQESEAVRAAMAEQSAAADRHASALVTATNRLVWATAFLAVATVALVVATVIHG